MPMSIKELDRTYRRNYRRLVIGIAVLYGAVLLAGLAALLNPTIAGWTSQGVQAEFVGSEAPSKPMRLAQPAKSVRSVYLGQRE